MAGAGFSSNAHSRQDLGLPRVLGDQEEQEEGGEQEAEQRQLAQHARPSYHIREKGLVLFCIMQIGSLLNSLFSAPTQPEQQPIEQNVHRTNSSTKDDQEEQHGPCHWPAMERVQRSTKTPRGSC